MNLKNFKTGEKHSTVYKWYYSSITHLSYIRWINVIRLDYITSCQSTVRKKKKNNYSLKKLPMTKTEYNNGKWQNGNVRI